MRTLQAREKLFLAAGAAVALAFIGLRLVQGTLFERLERLDRQIAARQSEIGEMQVLMERHRALQARLGALELRLDERGAESFLTRLGGIVSEARMDGRLDGIHPQRETELEGLVQSIVEARFSRMTLAQVVDLLRRLTLGRTLIQIQRLSIERRYENPDELDLSLLLASYQRKP